MRHASMLWGNVKVKVTQSGGIEMDVIDGYIVWKRTGDTTWNQLIALSALKGDDGREVKLRENAGYVEWKYDDEISWTQLFKIPSDGIDGEDGVDGDSAYVYIAYASDDSGTDFTTTFNPALDYIAILATDTEIPSPAVGDFAGLWKSLGGSGESYKWYLHQKPVPPISEPTNVQISVNGSGSIMESYPAGFFQVWAVNENGATLPVDVPAFDILDGTTSIVVSWGEVTGATGYVINGVVANGYWSVTETSIDLVTMPDSPALPVPTENTTGLTGISIEKEDTVDVVGDGIDVEFSEDEEDSTKKIVSLKKQQSDWDEEDTESPNYIKGKPEITTNTDEKVKFDSQDLTAGYLSEKIIAGENITITEGTGENENKLEINASLTISPEIAEEIADNLFGAIKDGYIYNQYALLDAKNILSEGWHIPTINELSDLLTYATNNGGITGLFTAESGGTNSLKFNLTLAGSRNTNISGRLDEGVFVGKGNNINLWSSDSGVNGSYEKFISLLYNATSIWKPTNGDYVRPVKDSTILANGEEGTYTGNDGKKYTTICINGKEWLAQNLAETEYRTGDPVPEVTDNYGWAELATGARCSYDNDESNAIIPASVGHNDLPGLQGGNETERYHLTAAELADVQALGSISTYTYVAYASDNSGTGFSLTPTDSLKYRAEIHVTEELDPPAESDFSGATWVKYIGDDGEDGREVILRINNGWVEWKYDGEETWLQLFKVPVDGNDGHEVQLRENNGWVEWKYDNQANWTQLFEIPEGGGNGGGGAATFLELTDTPASYSGQKGKIPIVKDAETGLEFINLCDAISLCDIIKDLQDDIEDLKDEVDEIVTGQTAFIATWNVDAGNFTLPAQNIGAYNCTIDWGDGSPKSQVTAWDSANLTHNYANAGEYDIAISGVYGNFNINNSATWRSRLLEIKQWGTGVFQTFQNAFYGCNNLIIPDGAITCTILGTGSVFRQTFRNCSSISYIPPKIFSKQIHITTSAFAATFYGCTGLTGSIPADLFRYNTQVTTYAFYYTFHGCTGLTGSIPTDLFRYNINVTTGAFYGTFQGCTGLTGSIPADLFRYNINVTTDAFRATFYGCTGLTGSIPADLFRYNTLASTSAFQYTFSGCTGLTGSIPADLFRYNTQVTTSAFYYTFSGCTGLTEAPNGLFKYNLLASTNAFYYTFYGCTGLKLNKYIFCDPGDENVRFKNISTSFESCFYRDSYDGDLGEAPELWDYDFGTGTVIKTLCFGGAGNSLDSLSNYNNIPNDWK